MSRTTSALLCAAVLLQPFQALAAEPVETPPSARAIECAARYNTAMHLEETIEGMMRGMMPAIMAEEESRAGSRLTAAQKQDIVDAVSESAAAIIAPLQDALTPLMTATFTEAELCGLAVFYESPEGQGVVAKMPAYSQAAGVSMQAIMPALQADMMRRVCKKLNCDATRKPTAQAS